MPKPKSPSKKTPTETDDQEAEGQEGSENTDDENSDDGEDENKRINAIVTNRIKREMKSLQAALSKQFADEIAKLATPAKKSDEDDEDDEDDQPKKPVEDPKMAKRLLRLEKEAAENKARAEKAEREKAEQNESTRREAVRGAFRSALIEQGVTDGDLLEAALDKLERTGKMIRDEGDQIRFKGQDKYGIDTNFDPKTGLKTWMQQDGKSFVPAVDAGGSGQGGARNGGNQVGKSAYAKMSDFEKASIELDRAARGLPPLE